MTCDNGCTRAPVATIATTRGITRHQLALCSGCLQEAVALVDAVGCDCDVRPLAVASC